MYQELQRTQVRLKEELEEARKGDAVTRQRLYDTKRLSRLCLLSYLPLPCLSLLPQLPSTPLLAPSSLCSWLWLVLRLPDGLML